MYSGTRQFLILAGLFFLALIFSILVNGVFMRFFRTFGIRDGAPTLVRWNAPSKPAFGGISFFIVFLFAFAMDGVFQGSGDLFQPRLLGLLVATGLGFLMGLADDAYNTRPLLKFLTQVACGVLLTSTGTTIHIFDHVLWDHFITVLWTVGIMNAINLLDNMDAVATLVTLGILASAMVVLAHERYMPIDAALILAVCGSLCGFLFFNWHPSRMFMGDTGSQFIGVFLAYVGIRSFWNDATMGATDDTWRHISTTVVVFLLPLIDTTVVIINRLLRGTSPFVGGKDHTTHHLSYMGLSDPQVALVFGGLGAISCFLGYVAVRFITIWRPVHTWLYLGYAALLFLLFFAITKKRWIGRSL